MYISFRLTANSSPPLFSGFWREVNVVNASFLRTIPVCQQQPRDAQLKVWYPPVDTLHVNQKWKEDKRNNKMLMRVKKHKSLAPLAHDKQYAWNQHVGDQIDSSNDPCWTQWEEPYSPVNKHRPAEKERMTFALFQTKETMKSLHAKRRYIPLCRHLDLNSFYKFPDLEYHKQVIPGVK